MTEEEMMYDGGFPPNAINTDSSSNSLPTLSADDKPVRHCGFRSKWGYGVAACGCLFVASWATMFVCDLLDCYGKGDPDVVHTVRNIAAGTCGVSFLGILVFGLLRSI